MLLSRRRWSWLVVLFVVGPVGSGSQRAIGQEEESAEDSVFPYAAKLPAEDEVDQALATARAMFDDDQQAENAAAITKLLEGNADLLHLLQGDTRTFRHTFRNFYPLRRTVELDLAENEETRAAYRKQNDKAAEALLKGKSGEALAAAQREVALRYFHTSVGDDAALALAQARLRRGEFAAARRLLLRISQAHPDSNLDKKTMANWLAVAEAGYEDHAEGARKLKALTGDDLPTAESAGAWPMRFGRSNHTGLFPTLPKDALEGPRAAVWLVNLGNQHQSADMEAYFLRFRHRADREMKLEREALLGSWREHRWVPTSRLLIGDGKVYYKRPDRVVCVDGESGRLRWQGRVNQTPLDPILGEMAVHGIEGIPSEPAEVARFGDHVPASMTLTGKRIVNLEGQFWDNLPLLRQEPRPRPSGIWRDRACLPLRTSFLSAYDPNNGKFWWRADAQFEDEPEDKSTYGFLGPPVPFGELLLVAAGGDDRLWLCALEQETGELAWRTMLCEYSKWGASPWSSPAVAVSGGEAYVATSAGLVFALDASDGQMLWATQYQRAELEDRIRRDLLLRGKHFTSGFDEDYLFVHQNQLVVLPADGEMMFALDRGNGRLRWESPRRPVREEFPARYAIGISEGQLVVGGDRGVRAYQADSGRLLWQRRFDWLSGRGMLTEDAIYLPAEDTIIQLELTAGDEVQRSKVALAGGAPLGNLFTDGTRIYSAGPLDVHALTPLKRLMQNLSRRIDDGDASAALLRAKQYHAGGEAALAASDLEKYFTLLVADEDTRRMDAYANLLTAMSKLALADEQPIASLQLIAKADAVAGWKSAPETDTTIVVGKRQSALDRSLRAVGNDAPPESVSAILNIAPHLDTDYLQTTARDALSAIVKPSDADAIRAGLASESAEVRVIACAGVAALEDGATAALKERLEDEGEAVQLAAAQILAARGDRLALVPLVMLLESSNVSIRRGSINTLASVTGEYFDFDPDAAKAEPLEKWQAWLAEHGKTFELRKLGESRVLRGHTLICYYSQNKVFELNKDGETVWEQRVPYAWGVDILPNGNRVVASYSRKFVVEYDQDGNEVWKKTGLPGAPFSVQRLRNGNTLVTCSDNQKVIEIAPDKSIAWDIDIAGRPMDAKRLNNGNTLIALQTLGKVVEVNRAGEVVWEAEDQGGVLAASRLENGNTLVCQQDRNRVVEVDRRGKVVWQHDGLRNPYDAQRLPGGNTLIVDYTGVQEINNNGEIVWQHRGNGISRALRY